MSQCKMNKSEKRTWTTALRSGKYKQGGGQLCKTPEEYSELSQPEYCCLGVAAHVIGGRRPNGHAIMLRSGRFGLSTALQTALAAANDGQGVHAAKRFAKLGYKSPVQDKGTESSFTAIANWIDRNL